MTYLGSPAPRSVKTSKNATPRDYIVPSEALVTSLTYEEAYQLACERAQTPAGEQHRGVAGAFALLVERIEVLEHQLERALHNDDREAAP